MSGSTGRSGSGSGSAGGAAAVGTRRRRRRALVLCLGDIGRSPRMQYHSLSLADVAGCDVDLVGFAGMCVYVSVDECGGVDEWL